MQWQQCSVTHMALLEYCKKAGWYENLLEASILRTTPANSPDFGTVDAYASHAHYAGAMCLVLADCMPPYKSAS